MDHIEFLRVEFVGMVRKGQWSVLPVHLVIADGRIRLSPLGVVPQQDRRPRTICDYTYCCINPETQALAPQEAMQFGRALPRILEKILHSNSHFGPVYVSKVDITDGFYRIWV